MKKQPALFPPPVFDHFVIAYCKGSSNWRWGRPGSKVRSSYYGGAGGAGAFLHLFHLFDDMFPPFLSLAHSHSIKTLQFGSYDDIEVS